MAFMMAYHRIQGSPIRQTVLFEYSWSDFSSHKKSIEGSWSWGLPLNVNVWLENEKEGQQEFPGGRASQRVRGSLTLILQSWWYLLSCWFVSIFFPESENTSYCFSHESLTRQKIGWLGLWLFYSTNFMLPKPTLRLIGSTWSQLLRSADMSSCQHPLDPGAEV